MSPKPRIIVADAQPLIAEAFEKLLAPDSEIVGSVSDGRTLLERVRRDRPDIVLLDLQLPLLNGLDAGRQAKQIYPPLKIIVMTADEDPELAATAFRFGASAYVLKRSAGSELIAAIREVMRHHVYVTPLVTDSMVHLMTHPAPATNGGHAGLTPRQREVLQLLAEGKSMKEAADILHVGVKTIAFHKYRMMDQLHLRTNAELIRFAVKQHFVP
jgi:DNA-binding NarL/FixJ family response regulator